MATGNNYMFWPLTGHHQVVHPMKRGVGGLYNIVYCTAPNPFHWMYNLMDCQRPKHVVVSCYYWLLYVYIYIYIYTYI